MNAGPRNPKFDGGTDARKDSRRGSGRADPRKSRQLCSQVQRALEVALTDESVDPLLLDVMVEKVEPTADDSRFAVWFAVQGAAAERSRSDVVAKLEAARPVFLREVAATINRRKLPELVFEVVLATDLPPPGP